MANGNNGNGNQPIWRFILQSVGTMVIGGGIIGAANTYLDVLDHKYRLIALEAKKIPPPEFEARVLYLTNELIEIEEEHHEIKQEQINLQDQLNELQTKVFGGRR